MQGQLRFPFIKLTIPHIDMTAESTTTPPPNSTHRSERMRAIAAIVGFWMVVALLDFALGAGFAALWPFARGGDGARLNVLRSAGDAKIVVLGNSRALHHFDVDVLGESCGGRVVNAACDGQGVLYHLAAVELMRCWNVRPRVIILQVDPADVFEAKAARAVAVAPFLRDQPGLAKLLAEADVRCRVKSWSSLWRYNSTLTSLLGAMRRVASTSDASTHDEGRHEPLTGRMNGTWDDARTSLQSMAAGEGVDWTAEQKLEATRAEGWYRDFIRAARSLGSHVVLATSPVLGRDRPDERRSAWIDRLADMDGVTLVSLDADSDVEFRDARYYHDLTHLNGDGARRYTRRLVERIDDLLKRVAVDPPDSPKAVRSPRK